MELSDYTNSESRAGESGENSMDQNHDVKSVDTDGENLKKILKHVLDSARQLDYVTSKCDTVESLFGSELISRRSKMKDLCTKLIFEAPKTSGGLARDKLWRCVFYDVVSKAKRLKRKHGWTITEQAFIKHHLLNGIGQISILLWKLQNLDEFKNLDFRFRYDGFDNILPASLLTKSRKSETKAEKWVVDLLYICLLNIGDLCRYLTEVYSQQDQEMYLKYYDRAQDYYSQAYHLNHDSGMAHNQLGNLSLKVNGGLDSVYYFLYSLNVRTPYDGALTNLRQLLDNQLVYYARLPGTFEWKLVDIFTQSLISMIYHFLCEPTHLSNFAKSCQDTLGNFVNLLREGISSLDEGFLLRIMSISIMSAKFLQSSGSTNVSAAVAFSIGIFVHLIERLFVILKSHSKLREVVEVPMVDKPEPIETCEDEAAASSPTSLPPDANGEDQTSTVEVVVQQNNFRRRRALPRRRPKANDLYGYLCSDEEEVWNVNTSESDSSFSDSSDESSSDSEIESETSDAHELSCSEDEEVKTNGKIVDSSEVSDISYQTDVDIERKAAELKLSQGSDELMSDIPGEKKGAKVTMKSVLELDDLLRCWNEVERIIIATLPFMRWLRSSLPVQNAFASTSEKEVLDRFCQLLNLLESTNWSLALKQTSWERNTTEIGIYAEEAKRVEVQLISDWDNVIQGDIDGNPFSVEMPEDLTMSGWPCFEPIISRLEQKPLTKNNLMTVRIGRVLEFGQWLVGTEEFAVIRSEKTFLVPSVEEFKRHMRKLQFEKFNQRLTKRKERNYDDYKNGKFGRGRRRREFSRFQGIILNDDAEKIFLVFDLAAVLKHLRVIQKLSLHPKFIIVFPHSISVALDELKDTDDEGSKVARIASRWLDENYNRVRTKHIRVLGKNEKLTLTNTEYPSIYTAESKDFYNALESCNYIRTHELKGKQKPIGKFFRDARDNYCIIYLTGHKSLLGSAADSECVYNPISTCRASHVFLDRVTRYQNRGHKRRAARLRNGQSGG